MIKAALLFSLWAQAGEQHAVAHFLPSCLHIPETAYGEAPMKDGEVDYSQFKLYGLMYRKYKNRFRVERTIC